MDVSRFSNATVSVGELLRTQQELETEAAEVLGFSIDECSRAKTEHPQTQSIYACLTCKEKTGERAGVCAGCSVSCHGDHELVELLQRRNFVCDCGTVKLGPDATCSLDKRTGQDANTSNRYDHNFDGTFCVCKLPYDHTKEESDMYQCLICEDWIHRSCGVCYLQLSDDDWDQYICISCVRGPAQAVLSRWAGVPGRGVLIVNHDGSVKGLPAIMNNKRPASASPEPEAKRTKLEHPSTGDIVVPSAAPSVPVANAAHKRQAGPVWTSVADGCIAPPNSPVSVSGPVLLEEGFRERFCRCKDCLPSFDGLSMLLEADDLYEPAADPEAGKSLVDLGLAALSNLPRERVIEGLHRYNTMRDGLLEYLAPLSQSGEVVTKEAIEQFFEGQRAKSSRS